MVLTDDNFATIIKAVESGRNIYENIKKAIQFLLAGNFAAILVVIVASLMSLPVPFAPVHLLFINLLTDSLPAIALGLEPCHHDVMGEKPRPVQESILTKDPANAQRFTAMVDSAAVYVNASTRFTDGGEFGLGCEMGISTQKLHARGPMGLEELCSYKYVIHGDGQIR